MKVLHTVASLNPECGGPSRSVPGLAYALVQCGIIGLILLGVFGSSFFERLAINPVYCITLFVPFFVNFGEYNFLQPMD